jgi:hypothetical protein
MAVDIKWRFVKEEGKYLEDPKKTRGYSIVEANFQFPFKRCLEEIYEDARRWKKPIEIIDIARDGKGIHLPMYEEGGQ